MYCTTCGKELPDGTPVCDECGARLSPNGQTLDTDGKFDGKPDEKSAVPPREADSSSARRPYMDYRPFSGDYSDEDYRRSSEEQEGGYYGRPARRQEGYTQNRTGFAVASLVLGILAICSCCLPMITIPLGILSVIFAVLGMKSINRGIAIAGLVLGIVALVFGCMVLIIFLLDGTFHSSHLWGISGFSI